MEVLLITCLWEGRLEARFFSSPPTNQVLSQIWKYITLICWIKEILWILDSSWQSLDSLLATVILRCYQTPWLAMLQNAVTFDCKRWLELIERTLIIGHPLIIIFELFVYVPITTCSIALKILIVNDEIVILRNVLLEAVVLGEEVPEFDRWSIISKHVRLHIKFFQHSFK